jgi:uncharacterized membrane protein
MRCAFLERRSWPLSGKMGRMRRISSVDTLRGAVMVLMALDHARDFFCGSGQQPTNLATTTPLLFFTRWVTHFCAPVFVFLAGLGAERYGARHGTARLARFLLVRGAWLVVLEVALLSSLAPDLGPHLTILAVLWVIGWSMIALAGLCWLPRWAVLVVGGTIVAGHNLLDPYAASLGRALGPFWLLFHQQGVFSPLPGRLVLVAYPALPWMGVMALGYVTGSLFERAPEERRRTLAALGLAAVVAFVILRALGGYGDPTAWAPQQRGSLFTVMAFLNCQKYPPSLLFLLMTLGPALGLLAALDGRGTPGPLLVVLGRVPLFFFVAHFALLRGASAVAAVFRFGPAAFVPPPGHAGSPELPLAAGYLAWVAVLLVLYWPCRWFAALKARHPDGWLSYL